jgi:hypothetical protein
MIEPRVRNLIVLLGASAGVVGLAGFLLARGRDSGPTTAPEAVVQGAFGVRGAASDSARRRDEQADVAPVVTPELPSVRPAVASPEPPREPRPVEPAVASVIMPSPEAVARSEAIAAILPAVKQEVEAGVEAQRKAMRDACWKGGKAAPASFPIEASFAADGSLLALSIADDRDAPEVAACVRSQPLPLMIKPPGVDLTVQTALTLP